MRRLPGSGWRVLGLLLGVGLAAAFFAVLALAGDIRDAGALLRDVRWGPITLLLALGILDHGIRYARWELLLKRVAGVKFGRSSNIALYLLGSLLIFTPARAGEVSKCAYARELFGIPLERSIPVLVAERVTDVAIMALLALAGLAMLGRAEGFWQATLIAPALLAAVAILLVAVNRSAKRTGGEGIVARLARLAVPADESRRALLAPGAIASNAGLGLAAWLVETAMYLSALAAVGQPLDGHHVAVGLAIFPLASLAGAVSLLPGGLGATEGGLATLGVTLGGLAAEVSAVAGLLARATILGVVIVSGLVVMALVATVARPAWTAARAAPATEPPPNGAG